MPEGEASDIASALVRISVVIVTYNNADTIGDSLALLSRQLHDDDELIVVDNAYADGSARLAESSVPDALGLRNANNVGLAAACNAGAETATAELLLFLNPDAVVAEGFREAIEAAPDGWGAWMGLVTMDDGALVNTSGGVLHFTGLGWAGQAGMPAAAAASVPSEVPVASGAFLVIPRASYLAMGGFAEHFFMYCEDVDLSLRARLRGPAEGVLAPARVDHDYDLDKGGFKGGMLERNRL